MRHVIVNTRNVRRLLGVVRELQDRPAGIGGMGALYGYPGEGKSSAVADAVIKFDGVFLRAHGPA